MRLVLVVLAAGSYAALLLAERTGRQDAPPARAVVTAAPVPAPGSRSGRARVVELGTGRVVGRRRSGRPAASASAARDVVPGIVYERSGRGAGRFSMHDALTLRPGPRGTRVRGYVWGWDESPAGGAFALGASSRGRIQIVGAAAARTIATGRRAAVRVVRWTDAYRLLAITGDTRPELLDVDVAQGKVVARHRLGGRDLEAAHIPGGLVALLAPHDGVGDARLAVLRPGAPPRYIELSGVRAGMRTHADIRADDPPDLIPGLTVQDGVAYVAPAGPPAVVRVDLASGAVTSHPLAASIAKGGAMRIRFLQPLAPDRLVLTGSDQRANGSVRPAGVRIVDSDRWTARVIDREAHHAEVSPYGILLAEYERRRVVLYSPDGRRRATFRPRYGLSAVVVAGRRAYLKNAARRGRNHRTHVLDLVTGRVVRTLRFTNLPQLLSRP